jgi:pilus assembly protein CpaE
MATQMSSSKKRVLLATGEPQTAQAVAMALEVNQWLKLTRVCENLEDLVACLGSSPGVGAALVDIDAQPSTVFANLEPIIARFTDTRFVILSKANREDTILEAMHIGVRYYLRKESIATDLAGVLQRLLVDGGAAGVRRGSVLTVFSTSGGAGATTVAVNLANELRLVTSKPVLVIDLDRHYGAVAIALGLEGQYGLADVLDREEGVDAHLVRSCASAYTENLHVLLSPASVNFTSPAPLRYHRLAEAVRACQDAYDFTVVDAPRISMDAAVTLARASKATIIVLQLTVKDIHAARGILAGLKERGISRDVVTLLVNRYQKRSPIGLKEAQKILGGKRLVCVTNDYSSAVKAANYGQLLAEVVPSSPLRRDLRQLALDVGVKETHVPTLE